MRKLAIPILAFLALSAWALAAYAAEPFDTALRHYYSGQYELAIQELKAYVETTPDPDAFYTIGYAYYNLGKFDEANKYFGYTFLIDPEYTPSSVFTVPEGVTPVTPKPRTKAKAPTAKKAPSTARTEAAPMAEKEAAPIAPAIAAETKAPVKTAAPAPAARNAATATEPTEPKPAEQPTVATDATAAPETAPAPASPPPAPRPPVAAAAPAPEAGSDLMDLALPVGIGVGVYLILCLVIFLVAKKRGAPKLWLAFIPIAQFAALVIAFKGAKKSPKGAAGEAAEMGAPDLAIGEDDPFADLASEASGGGQSKAGGEDFDDFNPFDDAGGGAGDQGDLDPFKEDDEFK